MKKTILILIIAIIFATLLSGLHRYTLTKEQSENTVTVSPVAATATVTISPVTSVTPTATAAPFASASPNTKSDIIEDNDMATMSGAGQEYDSFFDFPYDNMSFINDSVYESLKEEYSKINFYSEFNPGDLELYDLYKEKFKQLLDNEKVFIDKMGDRYFISELSSPTYQKVFDDYNSQNLDYYFFDIDEDGSPELTIDNRRATTGLYIFKFMPEADEILLWDVIEGTWLFLWGSKTICYNHEGIRPMFYKLDENGETEFIVSLLQREDFNQRISQAEVVYLAAMPKYMDIDKQIEITEEMRNQSYIDKGWEFYYFRVTEEQYYDLTDDYYKAEKLANENINKVSYSYDDLFNESY